MKIGKPKRIYRVEPLQDPVPREQPSKAPPRKRPEPATPPAR